jgi:P-type Ca2+ transporter type 2C
MRISCSIHRTSAPPTRRVDSVNRAPEPPLARASAGLSEAEAERVRAEFGPNALPEARGPSIASRVGMQLRDPMILLLLAAAALTVVLRDVADLIVISLVVVLNTAVGVTQEVRAEHALSALRNLSAPTARVVRDGVLRLRPAIDLVPGDQVMLEPGDIVPADLRLLRANRLQVDESALTGESVPVERYVGAEEQAAQVRSGTVVTDGRATGIVTGTGVRSALGRIAQLLGEQTPRPTPLQTRLTSLSRTLALVAVALSALVLVSGLLRDRPLQEMVLTAVSLAVAAVPESLPAVVTVALALGARRMAHRSAVVRELPAVETLGSVTVIASDKTGTLTEGRMFAERAWTPTDGECVVSGSGYEPQGAVISQPRVGSVEDRVGRTVSAQMETLLRDIVLCNDAELQPPDHEGGWRPVGDPTEAALLALAAKGGVDAGRVRSAYPRVAEIPFDSVRKRMTTLHRASHDGPWLAVCKGAPEVLIDTGILVPGPWADDASEMSRRLARSGYRVLAVSHRRLSTPDPDDAEHDLELAGLVAITDPPRPNAPDVVESIRRAGVELVLITGDHPQTALAIADRVGLEHDQTVVTGDELESGAPGVHTGTARLFARIRPEQKLDIVRAWQDGGHVVAMTGDGVNDGPALRRADIGVAMGQGGTEVARQAADLVLTDDNLGTVVAAIEEGRRIYANVRTFLRYALSGGLAEVVVMLLGPLLGLAVPLLPAQILWINLLTHGLPGVALGTEPAVPESMRDRPRSPQESVLGGGLWQQIAWTGALIAAVALGVGWWFHLEGGPWQTMVFLVLGLAQLGVAIALRHGGGARVRFLDVAVAGAVLLQLAGVFVAPVRALLGTETLGMADVMVATLAAVIPGVVVALTRVWNARRGEGTNVSTPAPVRA